MCPHKRAMTTAPHLLLNTVLLSHDGFIVGEAVNTCKKEETEDCSGPWLCPLQAARLKTRAARRAGLESGSMRLTPCSTPTV